MSTFVKDFGQIIIAALLAALGSMIVAGFVFYETSMSNDRVMQNQMLNMKREVENLIAKEAAASQRISMLEAEVRVLQALRRPQ